MDESHVEAFADAASDGVAFDGIEARVEGDSYAVEAADGSATVVATEEFADVAAEYDEYVTNWYFWHATAPQAQARWAFLRWVEGADSTPVPERYDRLREGLTTTWGQLAITVSLTGGGDRVYELRHEDDQAEIDRGEALALDTYEDPLDARELAKHDDDGQYRPLKTAPTLQTGWEFAALGPADLVEAVHAFYPATVQNWYREREGEFDVNHWHETVERQTGIYGVVQTWDRGEGHEHVDWVAEACCDDSQCLKRREWEYDEETALDPGGNQTDEGEFPCREPCSLVISAARKWTKLEGEESRTYEFELTPSEKEQVEEIIDAVADGRTADVREADIYDGANRYRTRFLRAKRFDDEGNLSGIETDD
ncbi:hypothetical protein KTS45_10150 [Halomicroarcula limicola]|uniref:DR2241 stabilising domain-containing protein n=1 Tax=Haloarcula limicola TaxID=1429915 RepID=A0A8J7YAZ9_9EURY|nr:DR2241 family protein [Halomicroarcula limicola]MBV0924559.1 hypothetical protein [Halomicroarcula limicola]